MLLKEIIEKFITHLSVVERSKETIRSYKVELQTLNRFLEEIQNGPVYIDELNVGDYEAYLKHLKDKGDSPATRRRMVYIIRSLYNYCIRNDILIKNVGLKLETIVLAQKERQYLTEQEFKQLHEKIDHKLIRLVVTTLFYTGLRIGECLNLTLKDVELEKAVILVRNTKSKKERRVPIHTKLLPLLEDFKNNWREGDDSNIFFATKKSGRLSAAYVNEMLHKADEALGWDRNITCHILRHSFASNLVKKQVSLVKIQKLLGHSSLKVTGIYTHTDTSELVEAVNQL